MYVLDELININGNRKVIYDKVGYKIMNFRAEVGKHLIVHFVDHPTTFYPKVWKVEGDGNTHKIYAKQYIFIIKRLPKKE